jgi:hypothetical protein
MINISNGNPQVFFCLQVIAQNHDAHLVAVGLADIYDKPCKPFSIKAPKIAQ